MTVAQKEHDAKLSLARDMLACRTPSKTAFASQAKARRRARQLRHAKAMRPYLCPCGTWHLTSQGRPFVCE